MPDVYVAPKPEGSKIMDKHPERKSVTQLKKIIGAGGGDSLFTSFASFPTHICFQTQEDEEAIVLFMRQHFLVNTPWIVLSAFMLTLPSVFAFFPPYAALSTSFQFVVSLGWYLFVSGYILARLMGWCFNIYIVTDERILDADFKNIFFRKVSTAKIDEIQDINVLSSGSFQTLFGYGSVFIQTSAEVPEFEFIAIPHPDRVGKILNQMIDHEEQEKIEGRVK